MTWCFARSRGYMGYLCFFPHFLASLRPSCMQAHTLTHHANKKRGKHRKGTGEDETEKQHRKEGKTHGSLHKLIGRESTPSTSDAFQGCNAIATRLYNLTIPPASRCKPPPCTANGRRGLSFGHKGPRSSTCVPPWLVATSNNPLMSYTQQ